MEKIRLSFNQISACVLIISSVIIIILLLEISNKLDRPRKPLKLNTTEVTKDIQNAIDESKQIKTLSDNLYVTGQKIIALDREIQTMNKMFKSKKLVQALDNVDKIQENVKQIRQTYDSINE
ncbi:MAG: hypothetical protein K9M56_00860 [Victivallales bacterium]|nr:hypothetical protein [Victivallales bacterium]